MKHKNHEALIVQTPNQPDQIVVKNLSTGAQVAILGLEDCRNYLLGELSGQYTLNAVVRIARFVSAQIPEVQYVTPTDLMGLPSDDPKIMPASVLCGIALLQADVTPGSIDGKPGPQFIGSVMRQLQGVGRDARQMAFMAEPVAPLSAELMQRPHLDKASERELYQYLKALTLFRNGLWSDRPLVTNILSLAQRPIASENNEIWNDQFFICWLEPNGNGAMTERVLRATGTTEPGDTIGDPTIPPQTYIVRMGYHKSRQPGGRGHRIMAKNKGNSRFRFDLDDDRGLNFHSGGSSADDAGFRKVLDKPINKAQEWERNMVLTELFWHLSHWGTDAKTRSIAALRLAAQRSIPRIESSDNNRIVVVHGTQRKEIQVERCINFMKNNWIQRHNTPEVLYKILRFVDPLFVAPASPAQLIITPQHVRGVVEQQVAYLADISQIDGMPGNTFVSIIEGKVQKAAAARPTLERVEALLQNPVLSLGERQYLLRLKFNTQTERAVIHQHALARPLPGGGFQIRERIGNWSIGCQVIYGNEQFYRFWYTLTQFTSQTGQRQWYYSLIEV
jgi:hypothetical protein